MNKKFRLFGGKKGKGSGETIKEVMDVAQRFYDDVFPTPSHKSPNIEKTKKPVLSAKYIREAMDEKVGRFLCHHQF